jgi:hypothetical protein
LLITELLANAPSTDSWKEFIEIYNPNNNAVNLKGYVLQVGPRFYQTICNTSGVIKPSEYLKF